jgi:hypothetical protein
MSSIEVLKITNYKIYNFLLHQERIKENREREQKRERTKERARERERKKGRERKELVG